MSELLMQAVCLTGDNPCIGCYFQKETCEQERPEYCVDENGQHYVFVKDGEIEK